MSDLKKININPENGEISILKAVITEKTQADGSTVNVSNNWRVVVGLNNEDLLREHLPKEHAEYIINFVWSQIKEQPQEE